MDKQIQELEPTGYMVINGTEIPLYEGEYFGWSKATVAAGYSIKLGAGWTKEVEAFARVMPVGPGGRDLKMVPVSALDAAWKPSAKKIQWTITRAVKVAFERSRNRLTGGDILNQPSPRVYIPTPANIVKGYTARRVVQEVIQQLESESAPLDVLQGAPVTTRVKVGVDARAATEIANLVCKQFQAAGWSASCSPESNGTGIYLTFTLTDARRVASSEHQQEAV